MTASNKKNKCIILLSNKSSGSSACQNLLAQQANISHIEHTKHGENETLYWSLAASILGLPQLDMIDSEIPIHQHKALHELQLLLDNNIQQQIPYKTEKELIFKGWKALCDKYAPIFFEKSPHHLYQWSSLELILACIEKLPEIDFLIIGLVRNPMDTLYSAFSRWKTSPEDNQHVWLKSYSNLLRLKEKSPDKVIIIRYEDMVSRTSTLNPVFDFCEVNSIENKTPHFHTNSLSKWKYDSLFGFNLNSEVKALAIKFGYKEDSLLNKPYIFWPAYRSTRRLIHRSFTTTKRAVRTALNS